jgi:transaldolase
MANTLLSQIKASGIILDIDSMDYRAAEFLSVSTTFHDMTSNQAIVNAQLQVQWDSNLKLPVLQYVKDTATDISTEDGILKVLNLVVRDI